MSPRTAIVLILLAACESRSTPTPTVGAKPASPSAGAWDPAALPRTVAVTTADDGLQLARVTTAGVEPGATVAGVGRDRGWLDGHTLVGLTELDSGGYVVARLVEGQRAADEAITPAEWGGRSAELLLGDGEIWLAGCAVEDEFVDCVQSTYLRVAPLPRKVTTQRPSGRRRYGYHGGHMLAAPSGAPPAGVTARVDLAKADGSIDRTATAVSCQSPDGAFRVMLDGGDPLEASLFTTTTLTTRWLATTPPLFEVTYDSTSPVEVTRQERVVFRPCDDRPLADFRWLGDGVWAERHGAHDDVDVGWTFHRGGRTIGELPGRDLD